MCLVCGSPASSRISSMFPWSAVMTSAPPAARVAGETRAEAAVDDLGGATAASQTPVWPTMSGFA